MDKAEAKQNQHDTWKSVAPGWARWDKRLRRLSQPVTDRFIVEVRPGDRVLDIASGVGEPAISLAEHVGPLGVVVGTDLVEAMLEAARTNAAVRGVSNVEFKRVDGEVLDLALEHFDVVTIRWGLMFMPDPVGCLTRAKAALKNGGRLVLSCWADPARNPWVSIPMSILMRRLDVPPPQPGAPGMFALADWECLQDMVETAGFTSVIIEELELPMSDTDSGADFLSYMLELAGPMAMLFSRVPESEQQGVFDEIAEACEEVAGGTAQLKGVTWIVTANA
jgi:ubiquinone/menaquinone biosynthesis C-methylase UbiE